MKKRSGTAFSEKGKEAVIQILGGYKKFISPLFGSSCRFEPTCSDYAREAVEVYGVLGGLRRALWRVLRCNPFSPGGYDPVVKQTKTEEDI
ncbi:MAG TPA: membrane protein insertion efficiency factor YidD [Candidatus Omnitrophota bacterium]|nr:membrane protein insertion efficiency factor YidD [Candidatus Omnitrophota bacterium]